MFPLRFLVGLFGVLARVGVDPRTACCLRNLYRQLRRQFQQAQMDGCPASTDLMNILFEPFHRWAVAQKKGVAADTFLAWVSFAGDVTLVAVSLEEVQFLISGHQAWCNLLRIKLNATKTQIWCNRGAGGWVIKVKFGAAEVSLTTRATFKVVGIELGALHIFPDACFTCTFS